MLNRILKISLGLLFFGSLLYASEDAPANWWKKGSYGYEATNKILTHAEGIFRYSKTDGNDQDNDLSAKLSGKIRKGHYGASLSYTKTRNTYRRFDNKSSATPITTKTDDYELSFVLGYDVSKKFFLNAGYINARDITFEVYNQTTMYFGLGYRLLTLESHRLNIFASIGSEDISFGEYPQLPSGKTNGYYYQANYTWLITKRISLYTSYSYLQADMKNRNTALFTAQLTIGLSKHLSFLVGYRNKYMAAQDTVNRYTNDSRTYTALKFEF